MPARFVKATDGKITWFRKTGNPRGFRYGVLLGHSYKGKVRYRLGFSNADGGSALNKVFPAVEIDAAEYKALVAAKKARVEAAGRDNLRDSSPQDAWVANEALAQAGIGNSDPTPLTELDAFFN